jgi:uncharacterized protein (TIGR00255 family)
MLPVFKKNQYIFEKNNHMIRSMTGFGKASASFGGKTIDAEIRSLNAKVQDINIKLPLFYREKEMEVRNLLIDRLERGKIDLYVTIDGGSAGNITLNPEVAEKYYRELSKLAGITQQTTAVDYVSILSRFPEVMRPENQETDPDEWPLVESLIISALEELERFRVQEGLVLSNDLKGRIMIIGDLLDKTEEFNSRRIETRREKLRKALAELADQQTDPGRFEQEMIYYLEKLDFTEEKIRLKNHLDFFLQTLTENGSQGRKLGFIGQEMGREINTLGSKAYDADIQKLVVMMKDELEKVKEQLANIL